MSERDQIPHCLVCGQRMILGTNGRHRCIYTHGIDYPGRRLLYVAWSLILLALALAALLFFTGCTTTVTPKIPHAAQASFDGDQQNSGFLGKDALGFEIITAHARDRYNGLIETYGRGFSPALKPDDGVTPNPDSPGTFRIDREHLIKFATMNRWRREGRPKL